MTHIYQQSTGNIYHDTTPLGTGYAGHGLGLNNPAAQFIEGVGPLPCGWYTIGTPFDHPHCGPYAMRLTPDACTEMNGRAGFLMHGDNAASNHSASDGCIVMARDIREAVWASGDRRLLVVEGPPVASLKYGDAEIAANPVLPGIGFTAAPLTEGGGHG